MGRTLKRVPLDFDWPLKKLWKGYINPYGGKENACNQCKQGQTHSGWALDHLCHLICIASENSLERPQGFDADEQPLPMIRDGGRYFPHPWLVKAGVEDPGDEFHELAIAIINNKSKGRRCSGRLGPIGHDCLDRHLIYKSLVQAAGKKLRKGWGVCRACKGHGIKSGVLKKYNGWKDYEPPKGEGYQLWETTSEGSPISPVFKTIEELCDYAATKCSVFGDSYASPLEWRKMLDEGFVYKEETMPDGTKAVFI
jgi:hypothetical protein